MDLKARFHNIYIHPESQEYIGIITKEAIFEWIRMTFGLLVALYWAQYIIDTLLASNPTIVAVLYLNEVTVFGDLQSEVRVKAIKYLKLLMLAGFMISLRKYIFCVL